ncbi:MAG: glycosyltransferase [Candidatus Komeilibacteria bacterium]|nr:glycosyltransferase [Candidatus Komeilibacteria bacterium]
MNKKTIFFVAGGTLGSVRPLLALKPIIEKELGLIETIWIGTKHGPEKELVTAPEYIYKTLPITKWRRYFSLANIIDVFKFIYSVKLSFWRLLKYRPSLVVASGSFLQVPIIWWKKVFGFKVIIYQLDSKPLLANRLVLGLADLVLTTIPSADPKRVMVGSMVADQFFKAKQKIKADLRQEFGLISDKPLLVVTGGGTGSVALNNWVEQNFGQLMEKFEVIHLTGRGKNIQKQYPWYHQFELLTGKMADCLAAADLVITRAGWQTLAELAFLEKTIIIVPLPNSPQLANANYITQHEGALVLDQSQLASLLTQTISLINDLGRGKQLAGNLYQSLPSFQADKFLTEFRKIIK